MIAVGALLEQSHAAHQRSLSVRGRIDRHGRISAPPQLRAAGAAVQEALRLRCEAHALDPEHLDPAWIEDQQANRGRTHEAMVTFLGRYLTPREARA